MNDAFRDHVEQAVLDAVRERHPHTWYEDHISLSLVENLLRRPRFVLDEPAPRTILWDAWFTPPPLQKGFGDIVVWIDLHDLDTGVKVEGCGLLEAKVRRDDGFPALDWDQLDTLNECAPHAYVALYDYEACELVSSSRETRCCVCPAQLVRHVRTKKRRQVERLGFPLSDLFIDRFFRGYDLRTGAPATEFVERIMQIRGVPLLLRCKVIVGDPDLADPDDLPVPDLPGGREVGWQPVDPLQRVRDALASLQPLSFWQGVTDAEALRLAGGQTNESEPLHIPIERADRLLAAPRPPRRSTGGGPADPNPTRPSNVRLFAEPAWGSEAATTDPPRSDLAVAETAISAEPATGEPFDITISVGLPYQRDDGPWACPVSIEGLHQKLPDIVGDDALQALCLALSLVRTLLQQFIDEGGQLLVPGTDDEYPLDAVFSGVGPLR